MGQPSIRNIVIIGSGPAGYTAAIYAARANLSPVLFEGFLSGGVPGGQLMTTTEVENYPGFPEGVTGPKLMEEMRKQALKFQTEIYTEDVEKVDFQKQPFHIFSKEREIIAHSVIIATGATAKRLDIPGTKDGQFWQKGVSACAVCDGAMPLFRNKELYVVGGGDTAMEEALFLTKYASKVFIVHRRDEFRASKIMAERALKHPKIEAIYSSEVIEVKGKDVMESLVLKNKTSNETKEVPASGLFFAIGHQPNTGFLQNQIELNANGYIQVKPGTSYTNVEGVFAAGDVQDFRYRQAVTAAGSGCMAALDAEKWLAAKGI